jgi:hypothetical protein
MWWLPLNAGEFPTVLLKQPCQLLARECFHTVISIISSLPVCLAFSTSTAKAAGDRFPHIGEKFFHGLTLAGPSRESGHFSPKPTFFSLVHHDFHLHKTILATSVRRRLDKVP